MKREILGITIVGLMIVITFISCTTTVTKADTSPKQEGDLIAIDIDRWFEEGRCYCEITIQNNDPNKDVTTDFWVQLRQDTKTGRYLGEVQVTEDLLPAEDYVTDPIDFVWQEGNHRLWAEVDWRADVWETNEENNWYSEWFTSEGS